MTEFALSHQEDPRTGQDRRDGAEKSGAKLGVRLLRAPPPPRTQPFRTIVPILAPEPSVLVRKAHWDGLVIRSMTVLTASTFLVRSLTRCETVGSDATGSDTSF